ncbi:PfkB family carbohydrate kinase [Streptomyces lydicus]|nr:PfkB family carbohydrate kinase [Streptomyces lydicus]
MPGEPVTVVDTIGAGDTVNGALLHRLDAHGALSYAAVAALGADDWRDILRFAAARRPSPARARCGTAVRGGTGGMTGRHRRALGA